MIGLRNYQGDRTRNGDFKAVYRFLVQSGYEDFTYGAFARMMTNRDYLEDQYLTGTVWKPKNGGNA